VKGAAGLLAGFAAGLSSSFDFTTLGSGVLLLTRRGVSSSLGDLLEVFSFGAVDGLGGVRFVGPKLGVVRSVDELGLSMEEPAVKLLSEVRASLFSDGLERARRLTYTFTPLSS